MLILTVGEEAFNNKTQEFVLIDPVTLEFEHSLVSLSKWESKFKVPFLSAFHKKTTEQAKHYIEDMCLTPNVTPDIFGLINETHVSKIQAYIESTESATTFAELPNQRGPGEVITAEVIYYWMIAFNIPVEFERWHLNRLFALIRVCNSKQNGKQKKIPKHELAQHQREINEARLREHNTTG